MELSRQQRPSPYKCCWRRLWALGSHQQQHALFNYLHAYLAAI